jgi:hypothetical protein
MSTGLMRRIEKLEEEAAAERASRKVWRIVWINPETGERTVDGEGEDGGR